MKPDGAAPKQVDPVAAFCAIYEKNVMDLEATAVRDTADRYVKMYHGRLVFDGPDAIAAVMALHSLACRCTEHSKRDANMAAVDPRLQALHKRASAALLGCSEQAMAALALIASDYKNTDAGNLARYFAHGQTWREKHGGKVVGLIRGAAAAVHVLRAIGVR